MKSNNSTTAANNHYASKIIIFSLAMLACQLALACLTAHSASAQSSLSSPGWFTGTAMPVPYSEAMRAIFGRPTLTAAPSAHTANVAKANAVPTPNDPEIIELARALRNDPDLIFEYVYNNIETLPQYGSLKGPLGTVLDSKGTAFDQAELVAVLLQISGYSAALEIGQINVQASQLTSWLGSDTSVNAIGHIIGTGGFPATLHGTSTTVSSADVGWAWVRVTIGGISYVFDPASKIYTAKPGLIASIPTMMGYDQASFLAAARSGATINSNDVSNLSQINVRNALASYSTNLVSALQAQAPNASPDDVLGGISIAPLPLNTRQRLTILPNLVTSSPVTNYPNGFPDALRAQLSLTLPGQTSAIVFNSCDIYARRISLFFDGGIVPTLRLDGNLKLTGGAVSSGSTYSIATSITHPYASSFANQVNKILSVTASANGAFVISTGWGPVGRATLERHRKILQQNAATSSDPNAEPVLGESLALLSTTWLSEKASAQRLTDQVGNTVTVYQHGVGIAGMQAKLVSSSATGPYVDLPFNAVGVSQRVGRPNSGAGLTPVEASSFYTVVGLSSVLESGSIEQTEPGVLAVSTVKLLDLWSQPSPNGGKIYDITNPTVYSSIRPTLAATYTASTLALIDAGVNAGSRIIAPSNGAIQINNWIGTGYYIIQPDGSIGSIISGNLNGGFPTQNVPASTVNANSQIYTQPSTLSSVNTSPAANAGNSAGLLGLVGDPLNSVTGDYQYSHDDLTIGVNHFPYGLGFQRSYDSGRSTLSSTGPDAVLGRGWTHNFALSAQSDSDGFEGMAATSPQNGASAIAAIYVLQDILNTSTTEPLDRLVIAAQIQKYWMDRLTGNVVRVVRPGVTESFLLRADGTYGSPIGSASALTITGGSYMLQTADGASLSFGQSSQAQPSQRFITNWSNTAGAQVAFTYNSTGFLTSVTNNLNRGLQFAYTGSRMTAVSDSTGRTVMFGYDGIGRLISTTDPLLAVTRFGYDGSAARLTTIAYPSSPNTAFVTNRYDTLGRVFEQRDANSNLTQAYIAGRRTELLEPSGNRHVWYFDSLGHSAAEVQDFGYDTSGALRMNLITRSDYDGQSRLTRTTLPEGNAVATTYDNFSNPLTVSHIPKSGSIDPLTGLPFTNLVWTYAYTAPVSSKPNYRRVLNSVDPNGNQTNYTYDSSTGMLLHATLPAVSRGGSGALVSPTLSYTYNFVGLLQSEQDAEGRLTTYELDSSGNRTAQVIDAGSGRLALRTSYTYDAVGNPIVIIPPRGNISGAAASSFAVRRIYDTKRRLRQVYQGGIGSSTVFGYDADDRQVSSQLLVNANSNASATLATTTTTYTPTGQRLAVVDPNGNSISYTYDSADRLRSATSSSGRQKVYGYDVLSRLTDVTDAVSGTLDPSITINRGTVRHETRTYTPNSLVATLLDGNSNQIAYGYDGFDRPARTTYLDALFETSAYDKNNNLLRRTTRAGEQITSAFDGLNRVTGRAVPGNANASSVDYSYGYDLAGRILNLRQSTDPTAATFNYDTAGRMQSETRPDGRTVSYTFDANGNPVNLIWPETGAQAYQLAYAYDSLDRLTGVFEGSNTAGFQLSGYTYDPASRRLALSYANGAKSTYGYRPGGQIETVLNSFVPGSTSVLFTYRYNKENAVSARLVSDAAYQASISNPALQPGTQAYVPNALNQYSSVGGISFAYDANGNLTGDGTATYRYDPQNRLVSATIGNVTASYAYDPQGRRASKTVNGITTQLLSAGSHVIGEYDSNGTLQQRHVFGPRLDEVLATVTGDASSRTRIYHHADAQGSIVALTNGAGAVTDRYAYTPYGVPDSLAGSPIRYTGRWLDAETGLYDMRARMYSPRIGRFLQMDPIGTAGGNNLYAYVGNTPLNLTDPSGLLAGQVGSGAYNLVAQPILNGFSNLAGDLSSDPVGTALSILKSFPQLGMGAGAAGLASSGASALDQGLVTSAGEFTTLYRVVGPAELADIQATGLLRNLGSAEGKYFTTSGEAASFYALQAVRGFGDAPYTLIQTAVPNGILRGLSPVLVDRGIPAFVIPNENLPGLTPSILNYMPIPGAP